MHVSLHVAEEDIDFLGAVAAFKGLAFTVHALGMPFSPLREALAKCMSRNDMLPFKPVSSCALLPRLVTIGVRNLALAGELGFAVEGLPVLVIDLVQEGLLGLIKRLVYGVAGLGKRRHRKEKGGGEKNKG